MMRRLVYLFGTARSRAGALVRAAARAATGARAATRSGSAFTAGLAPFSESHPVWLHAVVRIELLHPGGLAEIRPARRIEGWRRGQLLLVRIQHERVWRSAGPHQLPGNRREFARLRGVAQRYDRELDPPACGMDHKVRDLAEVFPLLPRHRRAQHLAQTLRLFTHSRRG